MCADPETYEDELNRLKIIHKSMRQGSVGVFTERQEGTDHHSAEEKKQDGEAHDSRHLGVSINGRSKMAIFKEYSCHSYPAVER